MLQVAIGGKDVRKFFGVGHQLLIQAGMAVMGIEVLAEFRGVVIELMIPRNARIEEPLVLFPLRRLLQRWGHGSHRAPP